MTAHTLHDDDLAWLELLLLGAVPDGYGPAGVPSPLLVAEGLEAGQTVRLLDPEGVTLATLTPQAVSAPDAQGRVQAVGSPVAVTPYAHPDHPGLRAAAAAEHGRHTAKVVVWGDTVSTFAFRASAQRHALAHRLEVVEVVAVPTGRETDARAQAPVRRALLETTRGADDRLVVVPWPGLGWDQDGLLRRAQVAAWLGARTLLVPVAPDPVTASLLLERTGVSVSAPDVSPDEALVSPDLLASLVTSGPLPGWLAEAPVAQLLAAEHRPPARAGLTILLSGLSGSGKSTVARRLAARLVEDEDRAVSLLDGDVVRHHLSKGLGFSRADRDTNVRRIGFVAAQVTRAGGIAVCCPIAPYDATRKDVRRMVEEHGGFVLVHVATPLAECERRDRKGLYAKARRGEIPEFTGISDPYETPLDAELTIDTTGRAVDDCVDDVLRRLQELGYRP